MLSPRIFRRRWVLSFIAVSILLIWVYTSYSERQASPVDVYQVQHTLLRQPFQWQPKIHDIESNISTALKCRNSVQGRQFIVDERGYVCEREDLTSSGCCDVKTTKSTRYNCSTCKTNSCCILYEHCVSCCLQPEKKPLLQRILENARDTVDKLFVSVSDHFELCLAKCRTSSKSVQHENSYRDPKAKHCYGEDLPDLQAFNMRIPTEIRKLNIVTEKICLIYS